VNTMDNKTVSVETDLGATLLLILFVALKLTGVIAWSWWWVLAPLWIPVAIFFLVLVITVPIAFLWARRG